MGDPMTDKQAATLAAIVRLIEREGYPPSVRELADELGVASTSTAHSHLKALEAKGWLVLPHGQGMTRALKISGASVQVNLPPFLAERLDMEPTPGYSE